MKNDITSLNNDERLALCRIITARRFKDYFRENPQSFHKIQLGYNYKKATEEETFSFVIKNWDEGFICSFINTKVQPQVNEIQDRINALVDEGKARADATTEALSNSVFANYIKLFFSLSGKQYPEEYILMTQYAIMLRAELEQAKEAAKKAEEEAEQAETEAKVKALESDEKFSQLQKDHIELIEAKISSEQEVEQYKKQLAEMQNELDGYRSLASYAVSKTDYSPAQGYTVVSLCRKYTDRGIDRLRRLADITKEGEITSDFINGTPSWTRLYQVDGPKQEGVYGIWDWTNINSETEPQKVINYTAYNTSMIPIEIIIRDDCSSVYDLVGRLKEGISAPVVPKKLIIAFFNGAEYEGLLCSSEYLNEYDGGFYLSQNTLSLAEFTFTENDIVRIDSTLFFRYLSTGLPSRVIKVKNPIEVTRDVILRRITKSVLKQKGFTTTEVRQVRDFLSEIDVESLLDEISSECDCSLEEAKQYVAWFVNQADSILCGKTPENEIMAQIIRNDELLLKECREEIRREWESQNQKLLDAANQQLADTKEEDARLQELLERKKKECASLSGHADVLQEQIQRKKQLANDVEEQVSAKIEQARKNAASFIAECAFTRPLTETSNNSCTRVIIRAHFSEGVYQKTDDLEIYDNWESLLQIIQAELREAGVANKQEYGLSGILYAAYINRIPILFAGPNGEDIANAFSLALFGCSPAKMHCNGEFDENDFQKCKDTNSEVVVIENPFEHSWYTSVLSLLSKRQHFYILVHPFAEDLVIEPNSLINYCFPMITEAFIDSAPSMSYHGGHVVGPFAAFEQVPIDEKKCYNRLLKKMKLSLLAKKTIQRILTDYRALIPEAKTENDYAFVLEPLARFLGTTDVLKEFWEEQAVGAPQ